MNSWNGTQRPPRAHARAHRLVGHRQHAGARRRAPAAARRSPRSAARPRPAARARRMPIARSRSPRLNQTSTPSSRSPSMTLKVSPSQAPAALVDAVGQPERARGPGRGRRGRRRPRRRRRCWRSRRGRRRRRRASRGRASRRRCRRRGRPPGLSGRAVHAAADDNVPPCDSTGAPRRDRRRRAGSGPPSSVAWPPRARRSSIADLDESEAHARPTMSAPTPSRSTSTDPRSVQAAFGDRARRSTILVSNAGTDRFAFFVNSDEALWDIVLGGDLTRRARRARTPCSGGMQRRGRARDRQRRLPGPAAWARSGSAVVLGWPKAGTSIGFTQGDRARVGALRRCARRRGRAGAPIEHAAAELGATAAARRRSRHRLHSASDDRTPAGDAGRSAHGRSRGRRGDRRSCDCRRGPRHGHRPDAATSGRRAVACGCTLDAGPGVDGALSGR